MDRAKVLTMASLPAAAGLAWQHHRRTARTLGSQRGRAPSIPGHVREIPTAWGSLAYRWIEGDPRRAALVLIHGWGKTGDSTWWPILDQCGRSVAVIDLPGHGRSRLDKPFTFDLGAEAVMRTVEHAGLNRPLLAAHSMGGPVAMTAIRDHGEEAFSGFFALATSAYWVRPHTWVMMAMAPYLLGTRSPLLVHTENFDTRRDPELAQHISWAYANRPTGKLLREAATSLRSFDATRWADLRLPPTTWVVATRDKVLPPTHQYRSARFFEAVVTDVDTRHSMIVQGRESVLRLLEGRPGVSSGRLGLATTG